MKKRNRALAALLAIMMLLTTMPVAALAAEPDIIEAETVLEAVATEAPEPDTDSEAAESELDGSLLPLEEHSFSVDYTGKLPDELKAVPVKEIFVGSGYTLKDTDLVSWSKDYYSESDDFTTIDANGTIDLRPSDSYYDRVTLTMIVGTSDQFDPNNTRYIVEVSVTSIRDMLEFDAATEGRQKIDVYNHNNYFSENNYTLNGNLVSVYQVNLNPALYDYGNSVYVSMNFSKIWQSAGLTATVYDGYYNSVDDLPGTDVTSTIWAQSDLTATGGLLGTFGYIEDNAHALTLVLKRGETIAQVLPFYLYLYPGNINVSLDYGVYVQAGNSWRNVASRSSYSNNGGYQTRTVTLAYGYPANGTYHVSMSLYNPALTTTENNGIAYVKAAYVGNYDTEEAAAGQTDIKLQLFSNAYNGGGYAADFSNGVTFTVFDTAGGVHKYGLVTKAGEEELSANTSFTVNGAKGASNSSSYRSWLMSSDDDSYYGNGFQTLFLMNYDGTPVTDSSIIPDFYSSDKSNVYAGSGGISGTLQESGKSMIAFKSGEAIPYTTAAENGANAKNYWVTFITQHKGGAKLFVNGANVDSLKDGGMPVREIFMIKGYDGDHHDILIANIGDQTLSGLNVTLENAQNIKLDDYWTVKDNSVKQLAPLNAETAENWRSSSYSNSLASNVGKVRLLRDGEGTISGTLKISAGNGDSVSIKLTGFAGKPQITTTSVVDGVKWVPYSSIIQTNYMYGSSDVSFAQNNVTLTEEDQNNGIKSGLPEGLIVKPSGEVYGNPLEVGQFKFRVTATLSAKSAVRGNLSWTSSATFILTINENTNENVWNATDENYEITRAIPNTDGSLTIREMETGNNSWNSETMVMVSQGEHEYFVALWLDGVRLVDGEDYTHAPGSIFATVRTQTLRNKGVGTHTLAIECREGNQELGTLKRASQNYRVTSTGSSSPSSPSTSPSTPSWTPSDGSGPYFPPYTGSSDSIVNALASLGIDWSYSYRKEIAFANGLYDYRGTADQNTHMLYLLKAGKLIYPGADISGITPDDNSGAYYPQYKGSSVSIVDSLKAVGVDYSFINREKIAAANGITNYKGTAAQNAYLLDLLKAGKLLQA